jgi:hypothetical protein
LKGAPGACCRESGASPLHQQCGTDHTEVLTDQDKYLTFQDSREPPPHFEIALCSAAFLITRETRQ